MAAKSNDLNKPTLTDDTQDDKNENTLTENYFAVSVLRDFILPDLLDKDTVELLYWAGKNLSRQLILDMQSLPDLFKKAGFGKLEITKQTKHSYIYTLTGPEVVQRFDTNNDDPEFSLETGIIAETVEKTIGAYCLGTYTVNSKAKSVSIKIQIDRN
ncbi:DUF2507 domain-containing protein [Companilactobacillus alimentarius]|uniref:DUF2507 domain-containing protein n=1 Tax=Companilactobacillus alimentarius DSM 20249 TaxID=1423720 RepID=A0A2N9YJS2_9LACO|nr:DUF2507 domain-containing protein [Companilactobacillus alimentarius]AUI70733.1 hypothetical protein LA20249_00135 [Companilactobacillus alimentarius DSM 20249]MDT6952095.1 DUF2507 domain-containing protein [Companilactobacillus alimentarius]GEO45719.1 hydrocarbon-binding protein [Companilactobacillus alimentarius]